MSDGKTYDLLVKDFKEEYPDKLKIKKPDEVEALAKNSIKNLIIIQGIIANKTWTQIADDLGIDRRQLYDLRKSVEIHEFLNSLLEEQLGDISTLKADGELVDAMKFRNQIMQAITPRIIRQKVATDVKTEFVFRIEEPGVADNPDYLEASQKTA